jgi:hypothetical protein
MILTLDTATTTGWAAGVAGGSPEWGARTFAGSTGEVIGTFRYWLDARCTELRPSLIVFEAPYVPRVQKWTGKGGSPPMNPLTLRRLLSLAGQVEAVAWEHRIECREVTPREIAKFFLGSGRLMRRVEKKAATVQMCGVYGWHTVSEDAADALAIWAMAEATVSPAAARARRGEGPLFIPSNGERPKVRTTRGALKPSDEKDSSWPAELI